MGYLWVLLEFIEIIQLFLMISRSCDFWSYPICLHLASMHHFWARPIHMWIGSRTLWMRAAFQLAVIGHLKDSTGQRITERNICTSIGLRGAKLANLKFPELYAAPYLLSLAPYLFSQAPYLLSLTPYLLSLAPYAYLISGPVLIKSGPVLKFLSLAPYLRTY
jgi:hypothetical protein